MAFPNHDKNWTDVAAFVAAHSGNDDKIIAPDDFFWALNAIYRYESTYLRPGMQFDWSILHKGRLAELNLEELAMMCGSMVPVFANEVFVVLAAAPEMPPLDPGNADIKALFGNIRILQAQGDWSGDAGHVKAGTDGLVLPEQGVIRKFTTMSEDEVTAAMDSFWHNGGYLYETLKDETYYRQLNKLLKSYLGNSSTKKVLDLCCGNNRLLDLDLTFGDIIGVDISSVAIDQAKKRSGPPFRFQVGDAHALEFDNESFDVVIFCEASEHVRDIETVLQELARVLKPGGSTFITAANSDSLNQIISRKLGYGDFVTNYQHIREFSFSEMVDMLAKVGLKVDRSDGIFLYPYWGIPGVDEPVREITDHDPDIVELMRHLGELVGAEHAYEFALSAVKTTP